MHADARILMHSAPRPSTLACDQSLAMSRLRQDDPANIAGPFSAYDFACYSAKSLARFSNGFSPISFFVLVRLRTHSISNAAALATEE